MSGPVQSQDEHPGAGDLRPEPDCLPGTPQGFPVRLADAIGEWAAQQDPRRLPPGWPAEADSGVPEAG